MMSETRLVGLDTGAANVGGVVKRAEPGFEVGDPASHLRVNAELFPCRHGHTLILESEPDRVGDAGSQPG